MTKIKLDQHFLKNNEILNKEIEISNINKEDIILEIGPGDGRLTKLILEKKPQKLIVIEKDKNLEPYLKDIKINNSKINQSNFEYIIGNALIEIKNLKFNKLISNIPYSITEPLYSFLIENQIKTIILIHGKKFYTQITDKNNNNKNNKWFYFINSNYKIILIKEIKGTEFTPITKTNSVLIKLELITKQEKLTKKNIFLRELFNKKDRITKNSLIYSLVEIGITKKESKKIIENLNLKEKILNSKLKNLSNETFSYIIKNLEKIIEN